MSSYTVQFIVFSIPFSIIYGLIADKSTSSIIFAGIIFGFVASYVFNFFWDYNPLKEANYNKSELIHKGLGSHKRFIENVGGFFYLTKTQLLFVPSRLNIQVNYLSIPLSDIKSVSVGNHIGLIPNLLIIETNKDKTEKFLVSEREKWVELIDSELKLNTITPDNYHEPLSQQTPVSISSKITTDKSAKKWHETRKLGRNKYVLRVGILQYGLIMFCIFVGIYASRGPFLFIVSLNAIIWSVAGLLVGFFTWHLNEKKYQKYLANKNKE